MTTEEFYKRTHLKELDKFDKKVSKFTYYDMLDFAEAYYTYQLKDK